MTRILSKARISAFSAIMIAALIVIPVFAATIWISVSPGSQTTSQFGAWNVYMGKEPGCPETNLKFRVYFGDGFYGTYTNVRACYLTALGHYYANTGTYGQTWYVGQGSSGWSYRLSTTVNRTP